ncbi:substrate-binding periplasmic protein [Dongshaea marina]|uniref:substrate-binding periplasmic protein n=1 Tax=Dongshaea marina TaxID=2047966 RepID=UPI000D3E77CB|nr:transporter substrate-binding domain-containing protein [Dongshaea marina]
MRIPLLSSLLLGLCLPFMVQSAQDEPDFSKLSYLTEEYKPFNYTEDGKIKGLSVELLKLVWKKLGVEEQPIRVLPWARGYYLLLQKPNTVLFATARSQAREPLFKWACHIGYSEIVLLGKKDDGIKLKTLNEAKKYKISAVRSDIGEQLLFDNGFDDTLIQVSNRLENSVKQLLIDRVQMISTNKLIAMQKVKDMGLDPHRFEVKWELSSEQFCYAFNSNVDNKLVQKFQRALNRVHAEPRSRRLMEKYNPYQ